MFIPSFVALLLGVAAVHGGIVKRQTDRCTVDTALTPEQQEEALNRHNSYRANENAANEAKLEWDVDLAKSAQDWANLCVWKHALLTNCDGSSVGQNLYMIGGGNSAPAVNVTKYIAAWFNEKKDYTYSDNSCVGVCGHYTQVVWAKSMNVGCGYKECAEVFNDIGGTKISQNAVLFGCDYSPPGNYQGVKPFKQGETCSECLDVVEDGYVCVDNLCKPCVKREHDDCSCREKVCVNGGVYSDLDCVCECPSGFYGELCERSCQCSDVPSYAGGCPGWQAAGYCPDVPTNPYRAFMKTNCPLTCGLCDIPASCSPA